VGLERQRAKAYIEASEGETMTRTFWQKLEGTSDQVLEQLKRILDEGNVRRVVVKQGTRTVAEFPLTVGVIGALLAPIVAAIGALVALLADCTIEVEKTVPDAQPADLTKP
jgi:hypothetical protein